MGKILPSNVCKKTASYVMQSGKTGCIVPPSADTEQQHKCIRLNFMLSDSCVLSQKYPRMFLNYTEYTSAVSLEYKLGHISGMLKIKSHKVRYAFPKLAIASKSSLSQHKFFSNRVNICCNNADCYNYDYKQFSILAIGRTTFVCLHC